MGAKECWMERVTKNAVFRLKDLYEEERIYHKNEATGATLYTKFLPKKTKT